MKSAWLLRPTDDYQQLLQAYDQREIDALDPRGGFRLRYLSRLRTLLHWARRLTGPEGWVLEVGCSQANAGLLLAEAGRRVVALDLRPAALAYARSKHERGRFHPVAGSAEALPFSPGSFELVILGELLEHCAHPDRILADACRVLRPGGHVLVSTPNGEYRQSSAAAYDPQEPAAGLEQRQFGPGGDDHLFAFTHRTLGDLLRAGGWEAVQVGLAGSPLLSDRLRPLKTRLPPAALFGLSALLNRLPRLGRRWSLTLVAVGRKPRP